MKHLKKGRKFGREKKQREALFKILAGELFLRGKITTTEAKAKELKIFADKICKKMKDSQSVENLRNMRSYFPKNIDAKKIVEISKSLPQKKSGFVRIIKTGSRRSDSAKMAIIEIIKKDVIEKQ